MRGGQFHLYELDCVSGGKATHKIVRTDTLPELQKWAEGQGFIFRPDTSLVGGYWNEPVERSTDAPHVFPKFVKSYKAYPVDYPTWEGWEP